MWTYAKINWQPTEYFEYKDYNRIKNNIEYLIEMATKANEKWNAPTIKEIGHESFYFDYVLNVVENNLEMIANNTFRPSNFESTKTFAPNSFMWDYDDINRIERTTVLLYNVLYSQIINRRFLSFELGGDFFG